MLNQTIHVVTCFIFLYFLFSVLLDNVWLLYGEGTYWSLLGMKKSLIYFPFWCPSSQPLTKSTGKKVLVFPLSFISYKSLTCNFLIYLPYNSINIGHFRYENSNLALRLWRIKQKKSHQGWGMNNEFLLFYSPKPRIPVRILI